MEQSPDTSKVPLAGVWSAPLHDLKGSARNRWPEGRNISAASGVVMPGVGDDRGPDEKAKMKFDQRKRGKGWGGGLKFFEKLPIR